METLRNRVRQVFAAASLVATIAIAAPTLAYADVDVARPVSEDAASKTEGERDVVAARLLALGLTEEEASRRVAALTDADLAELAEHPEQLGMGGVKDKTLIIIAAILVLPTILLLFAF